MPSLRPLIDLARYDVAFFVDVALPALRALHVDIALHPGNAPITVDASGPDLDALFAGKLKTERDALDRLRAAKFGDGGDTARLRMRGRAADLRALVRALTPAPLRTSSTARDIGAETGAIPRGRPRDLMKRGGRYIKGTRSGGAPRRAAMTTTTRASTVVDRTAFALANLRAFVEAGLDKCRDASDDDVVVISPGEVRRE